MSRKKKWGTTAERYIESTLNLIVERGGSSQVNLREISRLVGCAHTNAYNYFESYDDLMWHAMRRTILLYGEAITEGLDDSLSGCSYFRKMFGNMVGWSTRNPGLHRFISSDPFTSDHIPEDIIETVTRMKSWIAAVLAVLAGDRLDEGGLERLLNVLLGYLDGEVSNLVNDRVLPGEDVAGRVVDNLERLFTLLTAEKHDGIVLRERFGGKKDLHFPLMAIQPIKEENVV